MQHAAYIEEVVPHEGYTEKIYKDNDGKLVDIVSLAKDMYEKDSNWANLAYECLHRN